MALEKGKHIVEEIDGVRCTIVEKDLTLIRKEFLKKLLELNGFEVKTAGDADKFTLGVTDLVFNPLIAVYEQSLKTHEGKKVSPAYWRQYTTESHSEYWDFRK